MNRILLVLSFLCFFSIQKMQSQDLYYPPLSSTATWETTDPATLGWCPDRIASMYTFLEQQNTKGFMVLKDGKIVIEKYFGTFTQDSLWYWASAGKTITSFLVGKAQEEGYLSINNKTSDYLGTGWTTCTLPQENNIKISNQLTMTTGLDDGVADNHCTQSSCLTYLADSGTRWAYHNAPYTLLEGVLENATGQPINTYTQLKLKNQTGITGLWTTIDADNVFISKVRSMARFGLLIQGNGVWNGTTLMNDSSYFTQMLNTSQTLNKSYGYLWWLNGKQSFMVPTSQLVFPGSYAPDAPADMFAGIGKNGQIVSIAPSQGLVVVRMGNQPNSNEVPFILCNQIWQQINNLSCNLAVKSEVKNNLLIFPNPATDKITLANLSNDAFDVVLFDLLGHVVLRKSNQNQISIAHLPKGVYFLTVNQGAKKYTKKFVKN